MRADDSSRVHEPPTINQGHIDTVTGIAVALSRTPFGDLAGADELTSEALLVLWKLALKWDPDAGVPFDRYLQVVTRRRLIDWLRHEYGRHDTRNGEGLGVSFAQVPFEVEDWHETPDSAPSVEDIVLAREELAEVVECVRDCCTERQAAAILEPLGRADDNALAREMGVGRATVHTHRNHARARLQDAMGEVA